MTEPLTPREKEIARLIARDKSTKEIANLLSLCPKTVDKHRTSIHKKLGTHSSVGIARYIWQTEIEPMDESFFTAWR